MNIKKIAEWVLLISLLAVTWIVGVNHAMLQNAKRECLKLNATSAEVVRFVAYCATDVPGEFIPDPAGRTAGSERRVTLDTRARLV